MKYKILVILLAMAMFSCQEEGSESENVSLEVEIKNEGESAVIIDWDDHGVGTTVKFTLSTGENSLNNLIIKAVPISDEKIVLSGLESLTDYILFIELKDNEEILWSETRELTTGYTIELVKYASTDDVQISAKLGYIASALSHESRTVIFMHEFQRTKSTWKETGIMDTLIKDGNLCVSFDFRGHGSSTYGGDITDLIEKPWMAREDFDATLDYLENKDLKRSGDVIVFGASIGACVATAASSYPEVIGGVAASAVEFLSMQMLEEVLVPRGMLYVAGELDKNVDRDIFFEDDARSLSAATTSPSKAIIIEGTSEHGVALFESRPELIAEAITWVRAL